MSILTAACARSARISTLSTDGHAIRRGRERTHDGIQYKAEKKQGGHRGEHKPAEDTRQLQRADDVLPCDRCSHFCDECFFRVSDIQVEGNTHYTDEEIIRAIDIEEGDNLFFFDRFAALSRVFAKLPYVEEVSVERKLPNKVTITVKESQALAYIVLGDEDWTIDHSCKVLGKATEDELSGLIPIIGHLSGNTAYRRTAPDRQRRHRGSRFYSRCAVSA